MWALRQCVAAFDCFVPVLRYNMTLFGPSHHGLHLVFLFEAFPWSDSAPIFDNEIDDWLCKENPEVARRNAKNFVMTMATFARALGHGKLMWESLDQHQPDLVGDIPEFCQMEFGDQEMAVDISQLNTGKE